MPKDRVGKAQHPRFIDREPAAKRLHDLAQAIQ